MTGPSIDPAHVDLVADALVADANRLRRAALGVARELRNEKAAHGKADIRARAVKVVMLLGESEELEHIAADLRGTHTGPRTGVAAPSPIIDAAALKTVGPQAAASSPPPQPASNGVAAGTQAAIDALEPTYLDDREGRAVCGALVEIYAGATARCLKPPGHVAAGDPQHDPDYAADDDVDDAAQALDAGALSEENPPQ